MGGEQKSLRVGIAGLGTVGGGLLNLLADQPEAGDGRLKVTAVSARDRTRKREADISAYAWFDDPCELAASPDIDVFVELIGGSDGPAKRAVEIALGRGTHVVTANKALLAVHGAALAALSEKTAAALLYEAAVGGGMPIVKALKESLAGTHVVAVSGILNGTCNFLLTEMEASGRSFEDVLADAQRRGFAEADPTTDVSGTDAAHKICILGAIAFSAAPDFAKATIEGVDTVTLLDIRMAGKLGYKIKLLAKAERVGESVRVHVHPALLPVAHPLAQIGGALNAAMVDAEPVGRLTFIGRGAGAGPTAAAVAADLIDLVYDAHRPVFGRPVKALKQRGSVGAAEQGRYYVRLLVHDRPGVIAAVSNELGRAGVSIESFLQDPGEAGADVPIVLTTRPGPRQALNAAVDAIAGLEVTAAAPRVIPIEDGAGAPRNWS
jgi:homoserine dehydrogenase